MKKAHEAVTSAIMGIIFFAGMLYTLPSIWRWPAFWGFMLLAITIRTELYRHREMK